MLAMSRVRVFSAVYGGISRVKRHHSGAVGRVLGKDLGNDFWCRFFLNNQTHPASPPRPFPVNNAVTPLSRRRPKAAIIDRQCAAAWFWLWPSKVNSALLGA